MENPGEAVASAEGVRVKQTLNGGTMIFIGSTIDVKSPMNSVQSLPNTFLLTRDSGAVKGSDGRWRRDPGPAEQIIEESMMIPGAGVTLTRGAIFGDRLNDGSDAAYSGASVSLEGSGSILAGDIWAGVDAQGNLSGVGGTDAGVGFGTPGLGLVALNATRIFITPRLWGENDK